MIQDFHQRKAILQDFQVFLGHLNFAGKVVVPSIAFGVHLYAASSNIAAQTILFIVPGNSKMNYSCIQMLMGALAYKCFSQVRKALPFGLRLGIKPGLIKKLNFF